MAEFFGDAGFDGTILGATLFDCRVDLVLVVGWV